MTPQVIKNIITKLDNLPHSLDGFDELAAEGQKKIAKALHEGHVDDLEFNGKPEYS